MHPEIDKMVKMAQSRGFLTVAQRNMILNKARELGDDLVEVEFVLSGIPLSDSTNEHVPNQNASTSFQQQNTYKQAQPGSAYQQHNSYQQNQYPNQQPASATSVTKAPLVLGIVSTAVGAISFGYNELAILSLAAGIVGLVLSNKEKKKYLQTHPNEINNPFKAAFVLSIIGIVLSGLDLILLF